MPLIARALTSTENVQTMLQGRVDDIPPEHDLLLEFIVNATTDAVERYCRRIFLKQTYTNEFYVGFGGVRLTLHHWPITLLTSVDESMDDGQTWTAVPSADYTIAPELDLERKDYILKQNGTWPDGRNVQRGVWFTNRVIYDAGYILTGTGRNLPYDLEAAVIDLCLEEYLFRGKSGLSQEAFQGMSLTFDRWPLRVKDCLRRYARVHV